MRSTDNIEKLLSETPVPRVQGGLHRVVLKQELLAQMQTKERPMAEKTRQNGGDLALATRTMLWRRILRPQGIAAAAATIVVAVGAAIFVVQLTSDRTVNAPPESDHGAAPVSSGTVVAVAVQPPPTSKSSAMEGRGERIRSLEQRVTDAQVIVVATALDFAPAPPKRPGDFPENAIRFRVTRVLKGNLAQETITTQTPNAGAEFIGHEWVVMLSPEYLAGKHSYAECNSIKVEPEVAEILSKATK